MLGPSKKDNKTVFKLFSANAEKIELCLFSDDEKTETKIPLTKDENNIWSVELDNINEGQKYGYRAHGKFDRDQGLFFNPHKLLVDPYAKEISKTMDDWESDALLADNNIDSANIVPKSIVKFDEKNVFSHLNKKPKVSLDKTLIYETSVKGLTIKHPEIPQEIRGKLLGLAHPKMIEHLHSLNITQVELLPITPSCGGRHLKKEMGLSDYWGYNPFNHFAVDPKFGTKEDFKTMVSELHKAGIEVCLDVVYNHTTPSQTISYEGIDALSYSRFIEKDGKKHLYNSTGCGNSFNTNSPPAHDIIYNSLTYWAKEMGVDAFRFDLAADCAQDNNNNFNPNGIFMQTIAKIEKEHEVKIYGEPWNANGIYVLGQMGSMMEWSDKHKKSIRKFGRGEKGVIPELASHLAGEEKPYVHPVAVHDGMPLYDIAHYNKKENWANNENNNDGCNENISSASPSEEIAYRRMKTMATLNILSRGIPLILGGDEMGRTQGGNNNAYCQDNQISWHNWDNLAQSNKENREMYKFMRKLNHLRNSSDVLAKANGFKGTTCENGRKDIEWIRPDGQEMQQHDWQCEYARTIAYIVNGQGKQDFMIIASGNLETNIEYKLPPAPNGKKWGVVLDTADANTCNRTSLDSYAIQPYACVVLGSYDQGVPENAQIMLRPKEQER